MRYDEKIDRRLTKNIVLQLEQSLGVTNPDVKIFRDFLFNIPRDSSTHSKLELYFLKTKFLKWLNTTDLKSELTKEFEFPKRDDETIGLIDWDLVFSDLWSRIARRNHSNNIRKQRKPTLGKIKDGRLHNGKASAYQRKQEKYPMVLSIKSRAANLIKNGVSSHKIVSILSSQYPLSDRQIRRYLKSDI